MENIPSYPMYTTPRENNESYMVQNCILFFGTVLGTAMYTGLPEEAQRRIEARDNTSETLTAPTVELSRDQVRRQLQESIFISHDSGVDQASEVEIVSSTEDHPTGEPCQPFAAEHTSDL